MWFNNADRVRAFRYEVRCWKGGAIADLDYRIGPALRVASTSAATAQVLAQVPLVPALTWGRRVRGEPEMWNSNSVIAWVLATAGLDLLHVSPPSGGRAPGWDAGLRVAQGYRALTDGGGESSSPGDLSPLP